MQNKLEPVHPGEILREEMNERGLSDTYLAQVLNVPPSRVVSIVAGQKPITLETAHVLSRFFKTSTEFWMNLQQAWDDRKLIHD